MENRKIRVTVDMEIEITAHEERISLPTGPSGYSPELRTVIQTALQEGRYDLVGESTIYAPYVKRFNQTYGTTYAERQITTRAKTTKTVKAKKHKQTDLKSNPDRYLMPKMKEIEELEDIR